MSGAPDCAAHTQGVVAVPASNRHRTVRPAVPGVPGSVLLSGWDRAATPIHLHVPPTDCAEGTSVNCVAFLNAQGARLSADGAGGHLEAHREEEERQVLKSGWEVFLPPTQLQCPLLAWWDREVQACPWDCCPSPSHLYNLGTTHMSEPVS